MAEFVYAEGPGSYSAKEAAEEEGWGRTVVPRRTGSLEKREGDEVVFIWHSGRP
jgi:hypothetical protein